MVSLIRGPFLKTLLIYFLKSLVLYFNPRAAVICVTGILSVGFRGLVLSLFEKDTSRSIIHKNTKHPILRF